MFHVRNYNFIKAHMRKRYLFLIKFFIAMIYCFPSDILLGQDAIFSQFYANPLYLNPAFAGVQICPQLHLNYRNHPFPDFGHLSTYSVSYQRHWRPVSGGIGLLVTSEHMGEMLRRHFIGGIYSYHTQLTRDYHLNFGVNAAYYRKDLQWDKLVFPDQYDPFTGNIVPTGETPPENTWIHALDISTGILFYSEKFFTGITGHHLTRPQQSLYSDEKLPIKLTLHGGTRFKLERYGYRGSVQNIYFSPNIIMQHQGDFFRINYGAYFDIELVTAGVWLRQDFKNRKTLIFLIGFFQEKYRIGYSYDYSLSGVYMSGAGVHEISISLNFACDRQKLKYNILNCPNF